MTPRYALIAASILTLSAGVAAVPGGLHFSGATAQTAVAPARAEALLQGPSGQQLGRVTLREGAHGVLMNVEATGLAPGWHAVHIHAKGDCGDAKFERAAGHVHGGSAAAAPHGLLNPQGPDAGDLPNLYAAADGSVRAELFTLFVTLGAVTARLSILDADGAALIVHKNADDYVSQPIGGAGERVACAVIKPAR